ncbi:MAG: hypothetical protein HYY16_02840 [Planctomycetes bacterium]|nr:hypothetical protein [Planctomycetota bacterium]
MSLIALMLALVVQGDDREARIQRAVDWYSDPDPQVRELGRRELIAIGPGAIPYLEDLLKLHNALEIHRLLREVERRSVPGGVWVEEEDLLRQEDLLREAPQVDRPEAEKYVWAKLKEGAAAANAKQYQRGYDIANALLVLEPKSRYIEEIRKLRRHCDNWITQTSLVRSRVIAPAAAGVAPGVHEFSLRMENQFKGTVKIAYDPGSPENPTTPLVFVEIVCRRFEPEGALTETQRWMEIEVEHEIPIAMGAQWEKTFAIDVGADFPDDGECIRVYTIGAWTQPMKLDFGKGSTTKRVWFEPATFKVVPKKHDHLLADPLKALENAMASGTGNEVFVAAMLASEEEKPQVVDILVTALEKAERPEGRAALGQFLYRLTGQELGTNPRLWRAYADSLLGRPDQAPPKKRRGGK